MSWLKRSQVFLVRCVETVHSPCCGEHLKVIGSRQRKLHTSAGEIKKFVIRRLRCMGCRQIHHELPDCIVPYKRYESACVEQVVSDSPEVIDVAAENATLYRWQHWFRRHTAYLLGCLSSISIRYHQDSAQIPSVPSQSTHQRIGRYVGNAPGWLARIVRPIANANCWLHTRSAWLSANA
jgi:hypothetical protein